MATSISAGETYYLRIANLLLKVAPSAVRVKFDKEFYPSGLQTVINQKRLKIQGLTQKKIINIKQWNLLFPSSGKAISSTFDVTLMTCLLRNLAKINIQDNLPLSTDTSEEAALSRIKFYRNEIAHNESGTLTEQLFHQYWGEISQAITLLGGQNYAQFCADLKVRDLDGHDKEVLIELRNIRSETIPKGAIVVHTSLLEEWSTIDGKVVPTKAFQRILELLEEEHVLTVIGPPGCGKSTAIHHAALQLRDKEDYVVVPVNFPGEIIQYYNPECKQVFVYDDICGKYAINHQMLDNWCVQSNAIQFKGHAMPPNASLDMTPLFVVSSNGFTEVVKLLLKHKAHPVFGNGINETPLFAAAERGHIEIVKLLLEFNADPNLCNNYNVCPMQRATVNGFLEVVNVLVTNGANPNHYDYYTEPPMIIATRRFFYEIVQILLEYNGDPNISNFEGKTCLHVASENGDLEMVEILLENHADPNVIDNNSISPLCVASKSVHFNLLKSYLARHGCLDDDQILYSDQLALQHQCTALVNLLLIYKADPLSVIESGFNII